MSMPPAPNAALLIDFDNVTLGIGSNLQQQLRHLLASDIIKGRVAVRRAYADWRRYPQYIVPLAESSIDMIMAPAYGSSKKNATDIRLAIDAIEFVFTRPEIGTYILLSGDSDFSSLVIKLKEYGKYVIGVGIRESSSDLLVQNCDEYYSYNALAGLVKSGDEETVKRDPWELVAESIARMSQNGDVMRSDRLKQVMQDIDPSFDEKDLGYSKFSRFCLDAAQRGLLTVNRLENGQYEVAPTGTPASAPAERPPSPEREARPPREPRAEAADSEERPRRGRGRGRGRPRDDRSRGERPERVSAEVAAADAAPIAPPSAPAPERAEPAEARPAPRPAADAVIGRTGERLTRNEAFDLVRRAIEALVTGDAGASARDVRTRAFELLGRDSESLSERNFPRILKDAHDADVIDLRRRGDDYEVALAVTAAPITEQLNRAAAAAPAASSAAPATPPAPRGMGPRGGGGRGGLGRGRGPAAPPPELLMVGVVETDDASSAPSTTAEAAAPAAAPAAPPARAETPAAPTTPVPTAPAPTTPAPTTSSRPAKRGATKRGAAKKSGARKTAAKTPAKTPARSAPAKRGARKAVSQAAPSVAKEAPRAAPPHAPPPPVARSATGGGRGRRGGRKSPGPERGS